MISWALPIAYATNTGTSPSSRHPRQNRIMALRTLVVLGKRNRGNPNVVSMIMVSASANRTGSDVRDARHLKSPVYNNVAPSSSRVT